MMLLLWSCDPTGPEEGFQLESVEFTGDPASFCEFTAVWKEAGCEYELFRSTEPGIESGQPEARLLCVTGETEWIDSDSLEWGTLYFYAVRADGSLWSNEVCSATPASPYPPPCELSWEKTGFTDCSLQWTEAQGGFSSYAVLRSDYPNIAGFYWYADTVYTSNHRDSLSYTDHFAFPEKESYYAVCVADTTGLFSISNEIEFTPGGDVPWRVSHTSVIYGLEPRSFQITPDGQRLTGSRFYIGYSLGKVFDAGDASVVSETPMDPSYIMVLSGGSILASHVTDEGYRVSLFSQDFETETAAVSHPPVTHAIELDSGILLGYSSGCSLVDPETLEILQTAGFGFFDGYLSAGGERVVLLGGSGIFVADPGTLSITGSIPGYFSRVQEGADGSINCCSSQRVDTYDPVSLALLRQFTFPETAVIPESALLPPECAFVYVPVLENDELVLRVWNMETGETPGTVRPGREDFIAMWDLLPSPTGDFLWCFGYENDGTRSIFRISL